MSEFFVPVTQEFEKVPEGVYDAVLVAVIMIGTSQEEFKGEKKNIKKIAFMFEIPSLKSEEKAGPTTMLREFTFSYSPNANLRTTMEIWRGKKYEDSELVNFDISKMKGQRCTIQVEHKLKADGTGSYAIVDKIKKAKDTNTATNVIQPFVLGYENFDMELFNLFVPKFIQTKMENTPEYQVMIDKQMDSVTPAKNGPAPIPKVEDLPF